MFCKSSTNTHNDITIFEVDGMVRSVKYWIPQERNMTFHEMEIFLNCVAFSLSSNFMPGSLITFSSLNRWPLYWQGRSTINIFLSTFGFFYYEVTWKPLNKLQINSYFNIFILLDSIPWESFLSYILNTSQLWS